MKPSYEQAVLVHLPLTDDPFGSDRERAAIFDLADTLRDAIDDQGVGLFDGEAWGADFASFTCMVAMQTGCSML